MFAMIVTGGIMAQRIPVVPNPLPVPSGTPFPHAPMLVPEAYLDEGIVFVYYPYSVDMTVVVRKVDGSEVVADNTVYSSTSAVVYGLEPAEYILEITINGQLYEGIFEI